MHLTGRNRVLSQVLTLSALVFIVPEAASQTITGELRRWHNVTLTFDGPDTSETASVNPFLNYRLNVTFTNGSKTYVVPGYYAADGDAADSSAADGNKWRVHFVPDAEGTWNYRVSFRSGNNVAVSADASAGDPVAPDGRTGSFTVSASNKSGRDLRSKGFLRYANHRYYRFSGSGEYFLKGGANSPENLLAYADFDGTTAKHYYRPHWDDWRSGDPLWKNGSKGRALIGAANYLAAQGMNSIHFISMTLGGDGKDVWPWTSSSERVRFDVSKLAQWEVFLSHLDKLGMAAHFSMQERENDQILDGGALGVQRRLYFREMIARFSHHLGIVWNIGEENSNTDSQRKQFASHLRSIDPYDHPVAIHTYPTELDAVFSLLLGHSGFDSASLQIGAIKNTFGVALNWITRSLQAGRPWVVSLDETGPASSGIRPDSVDPNHNIVRKEGLWPMLMSGGAGVEWYFGYSYAHNDLNLEDFRSRHNMWAQTRYAMQFFDQIPFEKMTAANHLTANTSDFCFARAGQVYVVYMPSGGSTTLNLGSESSTYSVRWYNPRTGAYASGNVSTVSGPGIRSIGSSPDTNGDWVALVQAGAARPVPPAESPTESPEETTGGSIVRLRLINAETNQPIADYNPIPDGATINLATLPTRRLNVQAISQPSTVGSVRFLVNGSEVRTESEAPYALAGDSDGNYDSWTPGVGTLTLTAVPYSAASGGGTAGAAYTVRLNVINEKESAGHPAKYTLTVNSGSGTGRYSPGTVVSISAESAASGQVFDRWMGATVENPYGASTTLKMPSSAATVSATYKAAASGSTMSVVRFVLINADTNQPIPGYIDLIDGETVRLSSLPTRNLNIQAITNPASVGSVKFEVSAGTDRIESEAPFALGGDTDGNYWHWTLPKGTFTITATPFTGSGASGTMGYSRTVRLNVVE